MGLLILLLVAERDGGDDKQFSRICWFLRSKRKSGRRGGFGFAYEL